MKNASSKCSFNFIISPSIFLIFVCFKLPPALASKYTGRLLDGVRETQYGGLFGIVAEVWGEIVDVEIEIALFVGGDEAEFVDSRATPRKYRKVVGLGKAIGLRNWSDILEGGMRL